MIKTLKRILGRPVAAVAPRSICCPACSARQTITDVRCRRCHFLLHVPLGEQHVYRVGDRVVLMVQNGFLGSECNSPRGTMGTIMRHSPQRDEYGQIIPNSGFMVRFDPDTLTRTGIRMDRYELAPAPRSDEDVFQIGDKVTTDAGQRGVITAMLTISQDQHTEVHVSLDDGVFIHAEDLTLNSLVA